MKKYLILLLACAAMAVAQPKPAKAISWPWQWSWDEVEGPTSSQYPVSFSWLYYKNQGK